MSEDFTIVHVIVFYNTFVQIDFHYIQFDNKDYEVKFYTCLSILLWTFSPLRDDF